MFGLSLHNFSEQLTSLALVGNNLFGFFFFKENHLVSDSQPIFDFLGVLMSEKGKLFISSLFSIDRWKIRTQHPVEHMFS